MNKPPLSEHAFRLLPYRSLASGIPRALNEWPQIELLDEASGNQFTARVQRPQAPWAGAGEQVTPQATASYINACREMWDGDDKHDTEEGAP